MSKKPKKADIGRCDFAFVDCDPLPGESAADGKERHRKALESLPTPPTFIIDTGNGLCALWRLKNPVRLARDNASAVKACESINVGLKVALGGKALGADDCHSIDHLMRLPHTVNLPNAKKRAAGRVPAVSSLLSHHPDRIYATTELPFSNAPTFDDVAPISIGNSEDVEVDDLPVSDETKEIIRDGKDKGERSEAIYRVVCELYREGVPTNKILGVLLDRRNGIGDRFRERGEHAEDAARRDIERAIKKAKAKLHSEFRDDIDDDGDAPSGTSTATKSTLITPSPYVWVDPTTLPPRRWVYKPFYVRKYAGSTVATGGAGKSSLLLTEAVAMAAGKDLLGVPPQPGLKVWYWNGEDPDEELQRRVAAIVKHYKVSPEEIDGRLFLDSGRDMVIRIAELNDGKTKIAVPIVKRLIEVIKSLGIDVLIVDPFVSTHGVPENDNNAIDQVAKTWAFIADKTDSHVHISHHTRKSNGMGTTAEDSRGASSLHNAMRTRRSISVMSVGEANKVGIKENARLAYFKSDTTGSSMTKPAEAQDWYKFESVSLYNGEEFGLDGDEVGVVTKWKYTLPSAGDLSEQDVEVAVAALGLGGPWRAHHTAEKWAGEAVAAALHLDAVQDKKTIKKYLDEWLAQGRIELYEGKDSNRNSAKFVRPLDFG